MILHHEKYNFTVIVSSNPISVYYYMYITNTQKHNTNVYSTTYIFNLYICDCDLILICNPVSIMI